MMKAAVVTSYTEPLEIKQVPIPQVGSNSLLVKTIACGVCHSDLHIAKGDWDFEGLLPKILGHEGVGEVVQLGSNVDDHIKIGDIVGIPLIEKTCLHCEYCLTGRETLCFDQRNSDFATKLPEGMDPYTSAPLFCTGVTVYKALKVSQARPGQWVSIVGVGGLGSLAVAYGVAMGLRILAVVAPDDKTAVTLTKDMGAEEVYDGPSDKHSDWVKTRTDGGVQSIIITVPLIQAYEQGFKSLKRGGRLVAVGLPIGNNGNRIKLSGWSSLEKTAYQKSAIYSAAPVMSLPIVDCAVNGTEIVGSVVGTRQDMKEALELAKLHKITCKVQKRKLKDINEILDEMINYKISGRVVLDFAAK